jgi:dTDP-4-dehydrorhamnose 3,5-epimerase-like enzyme
MITFDPGYHDQGGHYGLETKLVDVDPGDLKPPFEIKRVYYIYGAPADAVRGKHAHKRLWQMAIAVKGSCVIDCTDGKERESFPLDNPRKGLLIGNLIWHEMRDFSPDCVLMVLASAPFDPDDYIGDTEELSAPNIQSR